MVPASRDMPIAEKLEELARLGSLSWPTEEKQYDWAAVEASLGFSFPTEFKAYTQYFPPGAYREQLQVFHPAMPGRYGLVQKIRTYADGFQRHADIDARSGRPDIPPPIYRFYPAPRGLIPWAAYQTAAALCWLPESDDPDQWPVIFYSDSWIYARMEGTSLDALIGLVSGQAGHGVFPEQMYEDPVEFVPWDPDEFAALERSYLEG